MSDEQKMSRVLLITGGHAFDREPFLEAWNSASGFDVTHVSHPEAQDWLATGKATRFDAVVFYDMPGVEPLEQFAPEVPERIIRAFGELTRVGTGLVFLHHALASWPTWPGYAELVGGRYHFRPGVLQGKRWPDSGYLHDVTHEITVEDPSHPVCAGLPSSFTIRDELYLAPVMEDSVTPLLRSNFDFVTENFWSTGRAMQGFRQNREEWQHPRGSNLVGWTRKTGRSRIVYLQPGDGPQAYSDERIRRLWFNAVDWVAQKNPVMEGKEN